MQLTGERLPDASLCSRTALRGSFYPDVRHSPALSWHTSWLLRSEL
ncbi:hypothetical protein ACQKI4_27180 [Paenibacillus glucanolyticus]